MVILFIWEGWKFPHSMLYFYFFLLFYLLERSLKLILLLRWKRHISFLLVSFYERLVNAALLPWLDWDEKDTPILLVGAVQVLLKSISVSISLMRIEVSSRNIDGSRPKNTIISFNKLTYGLAIALQYSKAERTLSSRHESSHEPLDCCSEWTACCILLRSISD